MLTEVICWYVSLSTKWLTPSNVIIRIFKNYVFWYQFNTFVWYILALKCFCIFCTLMFT